MKKLTDFIINKRNYVLAVFIILTVICAVLSTKVKINDDITKYLPSTSDTRKGMDIMEDEFSDVKKTSSFNIMFKGLEDEKKQAIFEELKSIENVSKVDYENTEKYNKDGYTLYTVNVDDDAGAEKSSNIYNEILNKYKDYEIQTNGAIADKNTPVLPMWIIAVAVIGVLIILLFMCESYIEPLLFLTSILIAIILNAGTNIIFGTISNITSSIAAILQLALSMDYSIMLINRFRQEKEQNKDKVEAMKKALYHSFTAISSSSATTIVGLLCLIFMSFTIGKDLGLVLAKGVLFSLISIFAVLPALILKFDNLITKTKKKTLNFKLDLLGAFSNKFRFPLSALFVIIFAVSFNLKGNLNILYTASENDEVSKVFGSNNQMAIVYKNEDEEKISQNLSKIEQNENVDEVLGYGNTINEKLSTTELVDKINDLGEEIDIEDYLLKILYYKYYNQNEDNKMTFDEMIKFIQTEVYKNDKMEDKLDEDEKSQIERLSNFTDKNLVNKKHTSKEIANILGMDKEKVDDLLVYYNSKNNNLQITLPDFVNFMNTKVLVDSKYSGKIDSKTRESLKKLTKFTNLNTIKQKYTSKELADLFGISENDMKDLFTYYISLEEVDTKLTIAKFSNFVLTDVLTNNSYAKMFDDETKNQIKMLATYSDLAYIKKDMKPSEIANTLGIEEEKVMKLLLLKYMFKESKQTLSIPEFINSTLYLKNNTNYLQGVDLTSIEKLEPFAKNETNINTTKMPKAMLSSIFNKVSNGLVDTVYMATNLPDDYKMSPQEFVTMCVDTLSSGNVDIKAMGLDETKVNNLKILKLTIDSSVQKSPNKYSSKDLSKMLRIDQTKMNNLYALIDYTKGNTNLWQASIYEFVNLILENAENQSIKQNVNEDQISKLQLLNNIMQSSIGGKTYSYNELAKFIGGDTNNIKKIYSLYNSKNTELKLTPTQFVEFVLSHKNDETLKGKINSSTINDLKLLQSIMDGVLANTKYTSKSLSSLLGMNKNDLDLIYGLYMVKNINPNQTISLNTMVDFLVSDVMQSKDYSSNIEESSKSKLKTVQSIIKASLNGTKYSKDEMIGILSKLSDDLEDSTIELLYMYYGSYAEYDDSWKMTVEEFINFLNDNILKDDRFDDFIDDDMKKNITDSKQTIKDAKDMLIGKNYSRIVINTKFEPETKDTFEFVHNLKDLIGSNMQEYYVIGDSPMAYEMSKTFGTEFNNISILTMIAIFVVVAITFKSIIAPATLVGVIQCAVYLTMGILSVSGGSVHYIALLIVQSILMGSTIDYAILYTSYYLENRKKNIERKKALINSYNEAIHTILTSSSILIIVTFIVGKFSTAITSKICMTLSKGTLFSTILILFLLPAILATFDRIISRKK